MKHKLEARKYDRLFHRNLSGGKASGYSNGKAAELLVEADLLLKGYEVTIPSNRDLQNDLHARIGKRWYSFQVKAGRLNTRTGRVYLPTVSRRSLTTCRADLLAVVAPGNDVHYHKLKRKVPKALK